MMMDENGGTMRLSTDDPRIVTLTEKLVDFVNAEQKQVEGTHLEKIFITTIAVHHLYEAVVRENAKKNMYVCFEDLVEEGGDEEDGEEGDLRT